MQFQYKKTMPSESEGTQAYKKAWRVLPSEEIHASKQAGFLTRPHPQPAPSLSVAYAGLVGLTVAGAVTDLHRLPFYSLRSTCLGDLILEIDFRVHHNISHCG